VNEEQQIIVGDFNAQKEYVESNRAVLISLFADYADTTYSQLLKQLIPIMRPITCEIRLVKCSIPKHRPIAKHSLNTHVLAMI